jgi:hypothetical protein
MPPDQPLEAVARDLARAAVACRLRGQPGGERAHVDVPGPDRADVGADRPAERRAHLPGLAREGGQRLVEFGAVRQPLAVAARLARGRDEPGAAGRLRRSGRSSGTSTTSS